MKKILISIFISIHFLLSVQCQKNLSSNLSDKNSCELGLKCRPKEIKDAIAGANSNKSNKQVKSMASTVNHHMASFYAGAGKNYPNSEIKGNASYTILNGFNAGVFLPGPTSVSVENFSYGAYLDAEYFYSNKYQYNDLPAPFNIAGQTKSPTLITSTPELKGLKLDIGLQFNILIAKNFVMSPIFGVGSLYIFQKEYSVIQKSRINPGSYSTKTYELLNTHFMSVYPPIFNSSSTEEGRAGCLTPKLRFYYYLNKTFGIWAEGNYLLGPKVNYVTKVFHPKGGPDQNGEYSISQMDEGIMIQEVKTIRYSSFGFKFGISISLPDDAQSNIVSE